MTSRNGIERKTAKRFEPEVTLVGHAGRVASGTLSAINGAPYTAGASALVLVLATWIVDHGKQPLLDARVYGSVLEALVEAISAEMASRRGARDVAA